MTKSIFISGIDTDAGKSYATGWLGNHLRDQGKRVKTQKFVQTGNVGRSEDIELHRLIMGDSIENEDWSKSAPIILSYPASADLAARIDGKPIDLEVIDKAREANEADADIVLIEGAGGLLVPIDDTILSIDYPATRNLDVALVTNGKLGSINHTLLSLEAIKSRNLRLAYLIYNEHFDTDKIISADTRAYIRRYVERNFPDAEILVVPSIPLP